jgi:hypothetical protein
MRRLHRSLELENRPMRPWLLARCNNRSASSIAAAFHKSGSCSDNAHIRRLHRAVPPPRAGIKHQSE